MKKQLEVISDEQEVVFDDYPTNKFAKKIDWWTSDKGITLIRSWREHGLSIKDIYTRMGVDPRTFRTWRRKCPALEEALIFGKEVTNAAVVDSLFKKAVGFYYTEKTSQLVEGEMMVVKIVEKYSPPDTKAILSWLFNRYSKEWRAVQDPIDVNAPALENAEDILIRIKEIAQGTTSFEAHPDTGAPGVGDDAPDVTAANGGAGEGQEKAND